MKKLLIFLVIFAFGFIIGAGAGFKILQGISTDLVMDAFENSSAQFGAAYSGSAAQSTVSEYQNQLNDMIKEQKDALTQQIQNGIMEYVKAKLASVFGGGVGTGN